METTCYLIIIVFLLVLAVVDLFVGVSNDAVNFMNSAIGAKVARFRTVIIVASVGIVAGAMLSAGMMDVARHGIMQPSHFSFREVMMLFLAVMVTDVIVLDVFNSHGMPTSTTVSLVFELLGGAFVLALLKMSADGSLAMSDLLNSSKALSVIIAIFVSVALAFVTGAVVQWISRLIFTFRPHWHPYAEAFFGGIAFTVLAYFIFIKGLSGTPFIGEETKAWIVQNTGLLLFSIFCVTTFVSFFLVIARVNIFRLVVLFGTFALAMAFASNDLVNFVGVPLAGLSSFQDWMQHGAPDPDGFMMTSLMESEKSPFGYLAVAGVIMIVALATSKKAQNVVKTEVGLGRQDESDEMFGSSQAARTIVRSAQAAKTVVSSITPRWLRRAIRRRFDTENAEMPGGASFDMVRASVNLVLASVLIVIGTNYKLPLSTTYVTFMVAMGTSLADGAWGRDSAVFRVTGVLSVIGGWFLTAGIAFVSCALVCLLFYFGGFIAMFALMILAAFIVVKGNITYRKKKLEDKDALLASIMHSHDAEIVWDLLRKHISHTQSDTCRFTAEQYNRILDGLTTENLKGLRATQLLLKDKQEELKKVRHREFVALHRIPEDIALEHNTWFHLGANSNQQFIYCLKRLLEPIKEHIDNNFNPVPAAFMEEFRPIRNRIGNLMDETCEMLTTCSFDHEKRVLEEAELCKKELSALRKTHIDRMQRRTGTADYKTSLIYLNILQESQELLSIMRHQLKAARKLLAESKHF
ncbi:MAG: inorganic phosphate transporter [Bacteroidales bacterium]|nr:inorganic phosphate transporter [Bacteroidales bacterium]